MRNVRSPPRSRTSACPTFYAPLVLPPCYHPLWGCPTTTPIILLLWFSWTCSSGFIKSIGKVLQWMPWFSALASQALLHHSTHSNPMPNKVCTECSRLWGTCFASTPPSVPTPCDLSYPPSTFPPLGESPTTTPIPVLTLCRFGAIMDSIMHPRPYMRHPPPVPPLRGEHPVQFLCILYGLRCAVRGASWCVWGYAWHRALRNDSV